MNELTTIEQPRPLDIYRQSTDAASVCKEIVVATSSTIQGRRYVAVEGWQAIAVAHGCVASAIDVRRITDEGATGFAATGVLRRMSDGVEIGRAEGFVGDDERTWGKRDVYAKRAMAQTRAISRVCRSAFAHVVVMMKAGLATTPAEEVPHIDVAPIPDKVPGISKIKANVRKMKERGNAATDKDEFEKIIAEYEADCTALCDAQHEWWTGTDRDGNEFESVPAWTNRRRSELGEHSTSYQLLVSCVNECTSINELQGFLKKHGDAVEMLDGEESRQFEALYDEKERGLKLLAQTTAGA